MDAGETYMNLHAAQILAEREFRVFAAKQALRKNRKKGELSEFSRSKDSFSGTGRVPHVEART